MKPEHFNGHSLSSTPQSRRVYDKMEPIATDLDKILHQVAGARVGFSLIVWTAGQPNYISNVSDRAKIAKGMLAILDRWAGKDTPLDNINV